MSDKEVLVGISLAAIGLYLFSKRKPVVPMQAQAPAMDIPQAVDPYMRGDSEYRETMDSTDEYGGTISGGRFVHNNHLPPIRQTRIQGGRFVHPEVLPPVRDYRLQIDYDNTYHFGRRG